MIKLEKTNVMNFENAIRGARNPMNSWDKGDSRYCGIKNLEEYHYLAKPNDTYEDIIHRCDGCKHLDDGCCFMVGENDLALARKLVKAGSDHRKFLRQIFVSVDITAPLYWWKEFDTYKVGTVSNSCSTMHKIHAKEFTLNDFSYENMISNLGETFEALDALYLIIDVLNDYRNSYNETKDKRYWYSMIQLLPSSYNQLRTVTMNYENLLNIYYSRKHHKLNEWHTVCDWIETLPYFKEMCLEDKTDGE